MTYESFVLKTVQIQHTPRTLAEAYRTPEYACAIYSFKTDNERGIKAIADACVYVGIASIALFCFYGFVLWLK